MNSNNKKRIFLFLLGSIFILYLIGCSTIQNTLNWAGLGRSSETGTQDKDLAQFFSNIRPTPGNPDSHYLLACYYQERGKHKEAIEEFIKVVSIDPNYFKAYNGMGISYDLLGDFAKAVEVYEAALLLNPGLDYVQNNLGYSLFLQGNLDGAIASFKKAIALNDREQRFHNNLGLAYAQKEQFDSALAEFKLGGDEATAHFNMAELYFKKGLYEEAKNHYVTALKTDPSNTVAQTSLKAANALASIFQSTPKEADEKRVVIPDPPIIKSSEVEENIPTTQTAADKEAGKTVSISDQRANPQQITEQEIPKVAGPGTRQADLKKPQESSAEDIKNLYEIRVASFRSQKNAISESHSLKEAGYQTSLRCSKDKKGKEWYLLYVGPPMSRDKALATKQKLEKEFNEFNYKVQIEPADSKGAGIEISNGNGVNRMARKVGDYLKERGLSVKRLTNFSNFNQGFTRIYYQEGHISTANHVAQQLPITREMVELKKLERPNIQVKVLLGKDMIPYRNTF